MLFFQLSDNAMFSATNCSFENIKHAIVMETEKVTNSKSIEVGSELADIFLQNIILNECKFPDDHKGKVILKSRIFPPFACADSDNREIVERMSASPETHS